MAARAGLLVWLLLAVPAVRAEIAIPPMRDPSARVHDLADFLPDHVEAMVRRSSGRSFELSGAPLVVVVVESAADYGAESLGELALRWFDAWGISSLGQEDGAELGVLLLVGLEEHDAEIRLGGAWESDGALVADQVLEEVILPEFGKGRIGNGVVRGAEALQAVAWEREHGPPRGRGEGSPGFSLPRFHFSVEGWTRFSFLPPMLSLVIAGVGLLLFLVGLFGDSKWRAWQQGGGIFLVFVGLCTWVLLVLVLMATTPRRDRFRSSSSGGYGGSSGGSSGGSVGGFSGGGGATGSW